MQYAGKEQGVADLRLHGRFDFSIFRSFRELYEPAVVDPEVDTLRLDFTAVEYVDSAALGMLLMLREKVEKLGKRVVLAGCQGGVRQLLDNAHFGRLFEID
jgi:anti-anti-sigma factor